MNRSDVIVGVVLAVVCVVSATPYFIHMSDPHVDFGYKQGSFTDCAYRSFGWTCCHPWDINFTPCDLAPRFGHPFCDPPPETIELIVEATAKMYPNPYLVLITGDFASHDATNEDPVNISLKWDWLLTLVKKNFGDNVKIIVTIGNHDVSPADQMSDNKTDDAIVAELKVLRDHKVLHDDIEDEAIFAKRGYYKTSIPNSNVDAVVMNNILDLKRNFDTDPKNTNPGDMYTWIDKVIGESQAAGRKVWIVGHVGPSVEMERDRGVDLIRRLLKKYGGRNGTISQLLFGHTHRDEYMLIGMNSLDDEAQNVAILAPGMTSRANINPSIRVVDTDGENLDFVDWHSYRMNMAESNKKNEFIFGPWYNFREYYEVPDLTPKSFQSMSNRMLNDGDFALKYLNTRHTYNHYSVCDADCRRQAYCVTAFREILSLNETCNAEEF